MDPESPSGNYFSAPIPFHLSPSTSPTSPISPGRCASSPELCSNHPVSDDSFNQAFTSIKTTDDSMSAQSQLLESSIQSDSSLYHNASGRAMLIPCTAPPPNNVSSSSSSEAVTPEGMDVSCTSGSPNTEKRLPSDTTDTNLPRDATDTYVPRDATDTYVLRDATDTYVPRDITDTYLPRDVTVKHLSEDTPDRAESTRLLDISNTSVRSSSQEPRKTRFQSNIQSYSATYDTVSFRNTGDHPGKIVTVFCYVHNYKCSALSNLLNVSLFQQ